MKFVIGIGNPGKEYEKTRHNVGFRVIDLLKKEEVRGVHLVKPLTYVNRTGQAVSHLALKYKLDPKDILIICDDVNLPFGKLRLRASGSAGGHKGLLSVIESLDSGDFPRLRIGVGRESLPKNLASFVLDRFSEEEEKALGSVLKQAAMVCETWAKEGFDAALTQL